MNEADTSLYRSGIEQDKFVYEYLMPFPGGTFLEAGAVDGEIRSNTYFFEHALGWSGVLIEPQKRFFPIIRYKRPNSHCFNCALGPKRSERLYLEAGDRSGLLSLLGERRLQEIERLFGGSNKPKVKISWIDVIPLMEILDGAGIKRIDYFSLDVEGGEMDILRAIDFTRVRIDLFSIEEEQDGGRSIMSLLGPVGYEMLPGHLGTDRFFARTGFLNQLFQQRPGLNRAAIAERMARPLSAGPQGLAPTNSADNRAICSGRESGPNGSRNLALGKPARQSSLFQNLPQCGSGGAVDGNVTGGFGFHTAKEANPWWEVDLQTVAKIAEIRIYNRIDMASARANSLQVFTSVDGTDWELIHDQWGLCFGGADGDPLRLRLPGHSARHVRLQLAEENYLHLDEVQVFGWPA